MTKFSPSAEISSFTIVSIIAKILFRSDQQNFVVQNDHLTIVCDIFVHYRPKNTKKCKIQFEKSKLNSNSALKQKHGPAGILRGPERI